MAAGDFDRDGYDDVVISVYSDKVGAVEEAGSVNVLYGSAAGLAVAGGQLWSQDSSGILGQAERTDRFGQALATGDFNQDGYDDAAIGVPGDSVAGQTYSGAVNILYGSAAGLAAAGNQLWTQDSPGILDNAEGYEGFGEHLRANDFNGDGYDDLAIGTPGESIVGIMNAGAVVVLYGSALGLSAAGDQFLSQNSPGILGTAEADDVFGGSL